MKNTKKIFVALCAVASLAACQKSAGPDVQEEPWVNDETLRVPVQLKGNAMRMETKAGEINELDETVKFGVFALGDTLKPQRILFEGQWREGCNCLPSYRGERDMAVLKTQDGPAYYPINSTNNYSFYGFHVQDGEQNLKVADDYTVEIPKYGLVDVLWAEAHADTVKKKKDGTPVAGFCAKYIREIYQQGIKDDHLPKFNFSHRTAAFVFNVVAADKHAAETFQSDSGDVRVTYAQVNNLPSVAKLNILTGKIVEEGESKPQPCNIQGGSIRPKVDPIEVCEFFLSPDNKDTLDHIVFEFTIRQKRIENVENVYTVTGAQIRDKFHADHPDFNNFETGKRYNLNITLQSAEKMEIKVSISEWEDAFEDDPSDILNIE